MIFELSNCSKRTKVKKIVQEIAEEYTKKLNNKFVFEAKLEKLVVIPFDIPVSKPYAFFRVQRSINNYELSIVIVYNSNNFSQKYVAFAIAHEFGHLLLFNPVDRIRNFEIKEDFEEAIADYLAYYIIADMNYTDKNFQFEKRNNKKIPLSKKKTIFEFEQFFGKSLFDCKKIDELDENFKKSSDFWYNIVTFNWENIRKLFEEKSGKDFEEFQDSLATVFCEQEM